MKYSKFYYIAGIPIVLLCLFFIFTEAFHLLSAPSDVSVFFGALLLAISLFILIKLFIFVAKKFF